MDRENLLKNYITGIVVKYASHILTTDLIQSLTKELMESVFESDKIWFEDFVRDNVLNLDIQTFKEIKKLLQVH